MILLKNPLSLLSLVWFWPLAEEVEFIAGVHLPFDDFSRFDVDGSSQRQRQVHVALGDGFLAAYGLNLSRVVHFVTLVN